MKRIEDLNYLELVDILAETTSRYTRVLKNQRYSEEHLTLREQINELIRLIEVKRNAEKDSTNTPAKNDDSEKMLQPGSE